MALSKTLTLFSEMNGRLVTTDGAPVSGASIKRTWKWAWDESEGEDITTTDDDGRFSFDKVTARSFSAGILPHEPSVFQEISTPGDEGPVILWYARKSSYDDMSELGGRPFRVVCQLSKEPIEGALFYGTCVEEK
ncbi:MAG: carboxypeptidase-like regulatory domain-containing protein [Pseudomonadota bacterium]